MATYEKRGKKWRVTVSHKGARYTATFQTKAECEFWANKKLYSLNHGEKEQKSEYSDKTLKDALLKYAQECSIKKKGYAREILFINKISTYEIAQMPIVEITTRDFAEWRDLRMSEVSGSTVRREATILKAVFRVAITEWQWLKSSPLTNLRLPKEAPPRDRRISPQEIQKMLQAFGFEELREPTKICEFVACAWLFAIETAMRSGEIMDLTWDNVHLNKSYVHVKNSKNGFKRDVALTPTAIAILNVLPRTHRNCFVITKTQRDSNFAKYRDRAGIKDLTFHDSRHEAITRLAQVLNVLELARMVGIRNPATLMVYYNETATQMANKLKKLS